jgi:hypothetical protein
LSLLCCSSWRRTWLRLASGVLLRFSAALLIAWTVVIVLIVLCAALVVRRRRLSSCRTQQAASTATSMASEASASAKKRLVAKWSSNVVMRRGSCPRTLSHTTQRLNRECLPCPCLPCPSSQLSRAHQTWRAVYCTQWRVRYSARTKLHAGTPSGHSKERQSQRITFARFCKSLVLSSIGRHVRTSG